MRALLILLLLFSCSSKPENKFQKLITQGKCEEASKNIPEFTLKRISSETQTITTMTAGHVMVGGAFFVDAVSMVTAGVIFPILICYPVAFGDKFRNDFFRMESNGMGECILYMNGLTQKFDQNGRRVNYGDKVSKNTEQMRCPKLDWVVDPILKIANCYEKTNQQSKALHQLKNLKDPKALGGCIDEDHLKDIEKRIQVLEIKG